MDVKALITERLTEAFAPLRLAVLDETDRHNVPAGSQSHWNVTIISDAFADTSLIDRHRAVHKAVGADLLGRIHALTMKTMTASEWQTAGGELKNPAPLCRGGSTVDQGKGQPW
ncbi:MAG: BolA/IbaG family iron-sulfur metabolism protein [Deltaproteobacteria bacterium]|nr:BolA/IbaG family iron-sulfur metabolism protein [Deltaproteobacteria bacterium]